MPGVYTSEGWMATNSVIAMQKHTLCVTPTCAADAVNCPTQKCYTSKHGTCLEFHKGSYARPNTWNNVIEQTEGVWGCKYNGGHESQQGYPQKKAVLGFFYDGNFNECAPDAKLAASLVVASK